MSFLQFSSKYKSLADLLDFVQKRVEAKKQSLCWFNVRGFTTRIGLSMLCCPWNLILKTSKGFWLLWKPYRTLTLNCLKKMYVSFRYESPLWFLFLDMNHHYVFCFISDLNPESAYFSWFKFEWSPKILYRKIKQQDFCRRHKHTLVRLLLFWPTFRKNFP